MKIILILYIFMSSLYASATTNHQVSLRSTSQEEISTFKLMELKKDCYVRKSPRVNKAVPPESTILKKQQVWARPFNSNWYIFNWDSVKLYTRKSCFESESNELNKDCNLRTEPSKKSSVFSVAKQGWQASKEDLGAWVKITYPSGQAYISAKCLNLKKKLKTIPKEAITPVKTSEKQPIKKINKNSVIIGSGINLLSYSQEVDQYKSDLSFSSLEFPSIYIAFQRQITPKWHGELSYLHSKTTIDTNKVKDKNSKAATTLLDFKTDYLIYNKFNMLGSAISKFYISFHLQNENHIFLDRLSSTEFSLIKNSIQNIALGPLLELTYGKKHLTLGAKIAYPISSKNIDTEPSPSFFIESNLTYKWNHLLFGLSLDVYYHNLKYNYTNEIQKYSSGSQNIINSNLLLYLGYEF